MLLTNSLASILLCRQSNWNAWQVSTVKSVEQKKEKTQTSKAVERRKMVERSMIPTPQRRKCERPFTSCCTRDTSSSRRLLRRRSSVLWTVLAVTLLSDKSGFQTSGLVPSSSSSSSSSSASSCRPYDSSSAFLPTNKARIRLFGGSSSSSSSTDTNRLNSLHTDHDAHVTHDAGNIAVNGEMVNGASHDLVKNGFAAESSPTSSSSSSSPQEYLVNGKNVTTSLDVPMPTVNGGYSHTNASRAKISAANKGRTPWNKGKARSEETRARIAAGVRAKNRQRFLEKLCQVKCNRRGISFTKETRAAAQGCRTALAQNCKGRILANARNSREDISNFKEKVGQWRNQETASGSLQGEKRIYAFSRNACQN